MEICLSLAQARPDRAEVSYFSIDRSIDYSRSLCHRLDIALQNPNLDVLDPTFIAKILSATITSDNSVMAHFVISWYMHELDSETDIEFRTQLAQYVHINARDCINAYIKWTAREFYDVCRELCQLLMLHTAQSLSETESSSSTDAHSMKHPRSTVIIGARPSSLQQEKGLQSRSSMRDETVSSTTSSLGHGTPSPGPMFIPSPIISAIPSDPREIAITLHENKIIDDRALRELLLALDVGLGTSNQRSITKEELFSSTILCYTYAQTNPWNIVAQTLIQRATDVKSRAIQVEICFPLFLKLGHNISEIYDTDDNAKITRSFTTCAIICACAMLCYPDPKHIGRFAHYIKKYHSAKSVIRVLAQSLATISRESGIPIRMTNGGDSPLITCVRSFALIFADDVSLVSCIRAFAAYGLATIAFTMSPSCARAFRDPRYVTAAIKKYRGDPRELFDACAYFAQFISRSSDITVPIKSAQGHTMSISLSAYIMQQCATWLKKYQDQGYIMYHPADANAARYDHTKEHISDLIQQCAKQF